MACIHEKVESTSLYEVKWYKEGLFWVAYEQSAYFVWRLRGYKPSKKYIKKVQKQVVSVGFPDSALAGLLGFPEMEEAITQELSAQRQCYTIAVAIPHTAYINWKSSLALYGKLALSESNQERDWLLQIKSFPLAYTTPVEALLFLQEMQLKMKQCSASVAAIQP